MCNSIVELIIIQKKLITISLPVENLTTSEAIYQIDYDYI